MLAGGRGCRFSPPAFPSHMRRRTFSPVAKLVVKTQAERLNGQPRSIQRVYGHGGAPEEDTTPGCDVNCLTTTGTKKSASSPPPPFIWTLTVVWQGHIGKPKTKGSVGIIFLPPQAELELAWYRKKCYNQEPEAFIFSDSPRPASKRVWLEGKLRPVSDSLGIPLVTYQVLRRTFATLMQKCGTIKDVQAMLRHTSPNLTLGTYTQALPESVKEAVRNLEQMVSIPDPRGRPV